MIITLTGVLSIAVLFVWIAAAGGADVARPDSLPTQQTLQMEPASARLETVDKQTVAAISTLPAGADQQPEWSKIREIPQSLDSNRKPATDTPNLQNEYGIECSQTASCEFYKDVLLVLKLNPVRLLWLDALLNFYGTGFPNIVVFSALQKGDDSLSKWLRVGSRSVLVHLMDDNYGFCDHATVALASQRWPGYKGYMYLSDDVLVLFWKLIGLNKDGLWKQQPSINPKSDKIDEGTLKGIEELNAAPFNLRLSTKDHLFAATSGVYFVPSTPEVISMFRRVSAVLLKHRSYNEWGTPLLLSIVGGVVDKAFKGAAGSPSLASTLQQSQTILRGKLVWGWKRVLVKKMMFRTFQWYHPIRAAGEVFMRLTLLLHEKQMLQESRLPDDLFTAECLNCASYPLKRRQMKGLLHSCVRAKDSGACTESDTKSVWPGFKDAALIGGRVVVPPNRRSVDNPLELEHEGFWGKDITVYMYRSHYQHMNRTRHEGRLLEGYPTCCVEP